MKYWRGYLVAGILAAVTFALVQFAKAHGVLVDMIYPYVTRLIITSMADWTGGMDFCLWQALVVGMVVLGIASATLMIILRWHPVQWFGWILAVVSCFTMLHTLVYGLNEYASPLADDVRLEITDYTVSELNEATVYFRDQANTLAQELNRDKKGRLELGSFEELAQQAAEGYNALTYDKAISVFAGSTVPVKKLGWRGFYTLRGQSGVTFPLTGEAAVNPDVPDGAMPFAMCKEMAHRMSIYSDADAGYAAFLACLENSSPAFRYSAYLTAYRYCYAALASIPTSTAQACAKETDAGVTAKLRQDLEDYQDFFGDAKLKAHIRSNQEDATAPTEDTVQIVTFSEYSDITDMLASWYIQNYILPEHQEEEIPFNPLDPGQVDISGIRTPVTP